MDLMTVGIIIGGLAVVLASVGSLFRSDRSKKLNAQFVSLGNVVGRSLNQVTATVGAPNAITPMPSGETLYQWVSPRFQVGLLFDENAVCVGIAHQSSY